MTWQKIGQLFCPDHNYPWMVSHAANPFAVPLSDEVLRVYFTCRNSENQSFIGSVDIDFKNNFKIISIPNQPVISPGEAGLFDDSGTAMGYLININGIAHLFYLGWNLKVTVPWLNTIGLATFNNKLNRFEKRGRAPVMDRSNEDPFSISYPSILFENGIYKMWYGSNLAWGKEQYEMKHVFKYAESTNGLQWTRSDRVVVGLEHPGEYALSKPFVIKEDGIYKMWYSFRANGNIVTYRIGYAESTDGLEWKRKDKEAGITVSETGWDSEMIEYPFIFDFEGTRFMLYNGNGYGKTGFGLAKLDNNNI